MSAFPSKVWNILIFDIIFDDIDKLEAFDVFLKVIQYSLSALLLEF